MVENGGVFLDTCHYSSVLGILRRLLLLPSVHLQERIRALGVLLLTLLPFATLYNCCPCEARCMHPTLTNSKGTLLSLQQSRVAPSSSRQRSGLAASYSVQQSSLADSCSSQQRVLSPFAAKPSANVTVFDGRTTGHAVPQRYGELASSVLRASAHGCSCKKSIKYAHLPRRAATGSKKHIFRQDSYRSIINSSTWVNLPSLRRNDASKIQRKTPKHLCCRCYCSKWSSSHFCIGEPPAEVCVRPQQAFYTQASSGSNGVQESCLPVGSFFSLCKRGRVQPGSAGLNRLTAFIAAGTSACSSPAYGLSPPTCRIEGSVLNASQCCQEGSATSVGETAASQPKSRPALPWRWKRFSRQRSTCCAAAAAPRASAAAAAARKMLRCWGTDETKARNSNSSTRLLGASSCCGGSIAASACRLYVAGGHAAFCGPFRSRTVTVPLLQATAQNLSFSTEETSSSPPPAAVAGERCRRQGGRHPAKEERILTVTQLENELQRRHRAVGLAIKAGDAAVAFNEFDVHLRCAAATVQKWMHHSCSCARQLQQPCRRWTPDSIGPSLLQSDEHEYMERQRRQNGQDQRVEEKQEQRSCCVHPQKDDQPLQWLHEGEESPQQKKPSEAQQRKGDEDALLRDRQRVRRTELVEGSRSGLSLASKLLQPFVKSASGVLNLCCRSSSDEASRSTGDLYSIARQVMRRLQEFHLLNPLNNSVGNAFLAVAAAAGDTEAVAATLLFMQLQGARPQRKGYDALLRTLLRRGEGYCRLRQTNLLSCMLDQRLPPTSEQLFALLLRDAARVSAQLEKEQQAVEKLNHFLQKRVPQHQPGQEPRDRECRPSQQQEPAIQEKAPPRTQARRDAETQKEEDDKRKKKTGGAACLGSPRRCSVGTAVRLRGSPENSSDLPSRAQEKDLKSHAAALAAAQAAVVEEAWWSLRHLREFLDAAEDALTLLQHVVSEQLPLLSEVAASRFVTALQNLRLPSIAHVSRVVIRHQADATTAECHYYGQEGLPQYVREEDAFAEEIAPAAASPRLPSAAAPEDRSARKGPSKITREGPRASTHGSRGTNVAGGAEKPCDSAAFAQEKQCSAGPGTDERCAQRGAVLAKDNDSPQQDIHAPGLQVQQQHRLHQAADPAEQTLPLRRVAVCAGCGTRLQRVSLSSNERRLLRLGVLKLSAMLHPRQLRALLAFEAALSSRQRRVPASTSAAVSGRRVAEAAAAEEGRCERQHHLQQAQQTEQQQRSTCSPAAVESSGLPLEAQAPDAAVADCDLPAAASESKDSFATIEQSAKKCSSGEDTLRAAVMSGECSFAVRKDTAAERSNSRVDCAHRRRPKERSTHAPVSSSNCRFLDSALSRFTVVLDAANIAYNSQNRQEGVFSYPQIERVRQELLARGEQPLIILPAAYYWGFSNQRTKKADGSRRTGNAVHDTVSFEKNAEADSKSSSRTENVHELLHAGFEEKIKRMFAGARWPPEAGRLWVCRMGLCPLCIDEIRVPNRCKKSSRWASFSGTPAKYAGGSCLSTGGGGKKDNDVYLTELTSPDNQPTSSNERYGTGFLAEGGQRLMCLDRALLRLWEQEGCLFVCRSGAHDDHYHLLASLSACSAESRAVSSPTVTRLRGAADSARAATAEDAVSERQQQGQAESARQKRQKHHKDAEQLMSSFCTETLDFSAAAEQQQCGAVRDPPDAVHSCTTSHKEQQQGHRLSAGNLLSIMLGVRRDEPGVQVSPPCSEGGKHLCSRTSLSEGVALMHAEQSLWHRLWHCPRFADGRAPAESRILLPALGSRETSYLDNIADEHQAEPQITQSAPAFLGYSWDDIACGRDVRGTYSVERAHAARAALSSPEEAQFPIALLTNDRFRDHRLSSQQKTAFKHWRQLALLPYVFQRRQTPGRSSLLVAGIPHDESIQQHTAGSVRRSARRTQRGAQEQCRHNSTKQQQQQHKGDVVSDSKISSLVASADTSVGEILDDTDLGSSQEHLSDGLDTTAARPERCARAAAYQDVPCGNRLLDEQNNGEKYDIDRGDCAARPAHGTGENLSIADDAWDGKDALSPEVKHTGGWSSDDPDILTQRLGPLGTFPDWNSKKKIYGQAEIFKRLKRGRKVVGRERGYIDYFGDEMAPQLFIGVLRPLTRRVQVSFRTPVNRSFQRRGKFSGIFVEREKDCVAAATKLAVHSGGVVDPRDGTPAVKSRSTERRFHTREPPIKGETISPSRGQAYPVVGERLLSSPCFPAKAALSLLNRNSSCRPSKDASDVQDDRIWHIPLTKAEEESPEHEDDLFETHRTSVETRRPGNHISTNMSEKQQALLHSVASTPTRNNLPWEKTEVSRPRDAIECTCKSDRKDQLSDESAEKKKVLRKDVFSDLGVLTQLSEKRTQGEDASEESDAWLGIDLAPLWQLLRAREQFLYSVEAHFSQFKG